MKTKKQFVNLIPISKEAKYRFFSDMNSFHGCEIKEETDDMYFLKSINGQYFTWVHKQNSDHWEIVK
jgi:hypothetical protein